MNCDPNQTGGDGGPHMRVLVADPGYDLCDDKGNVVGQANTHPGGVTVTEAKADGALYDGTAVCGGITRKDMEAVRVPMPEDRFYKKHIPPIDTLLGDIAAQKAERDELWAELANPALGKPHEAPSIPMSRAKLVEQLIADGVQMGKFELIPTEYRGGGVLVIPNDPPKFSFGDGFKETILAAWEAYLGQAVTRELIEKMVASAVEVTTQRLTAAMTGSRTVVDALLDRETDGMRKYLGNCVTPKVANARDFYSETMAKVEEMKECAEEQAKLQAEMPILGLLSDKGVADTTTYEKRESYMLELFAGKEPNDETKNAVLKNGWSDEPKGEVRTTTRTVPVEGEMRDLKVMEFFAYETVGATIPHTGTLAYTDDPELMAALHKAEQEGRVVYDKDGSIVEIKEAKPDGKGFGIVMRNDWGDGSPTFLGLRAVEPGPKSTFEDDEDVKPDAVVG